MQAQGSTGSKIAAGTNFVRALISGCLGKFHCKFIQEFPVRGKVQQVLRIVQFIKSGIDIDRFFFKPLVIGFNNQVLRGDIVYGGINATHIQGAEVCSGPGSPGRRLSPIHSVFHLTEEAGNAPVQAGGKKLMEAQLGALRFLLPLQGISGTERAGIIERLIIRLLNGLRIGGINGAVVGGMPVNSGHW